MIALVPARRYSKRIAEKNMRELAGRPLLYWTLRAAVESGCFEGYIVSTDDVEWVEPAIPGSGPGYMILLDRPAEFATDASPDIEWVRHALSVAPPDTDAFCILRPTSPFRTARGIRRAVQHWSTISHEFDSLRCVSPVTEHPYKMWRVTNDRRLEWLLDDVVNPYGPPSPHGRGDFMFCQPTQNFEPIYVQNASLEISHIRNVTEGKSISGWRIGAWFAEGYESFDLNTEDDWLLAEALLNKGKVSL